MKRQERNGQRVHKRGAKLRTVNNNWRGEGGVHKPRDGRQCLLFAPAASSMGN